MKYKVISNGRQYDIIRVKDTVKVEGGFFSKQLALIACDEWNEGYHDADAKELREERKDRHAE